jgi:hypothetical protein
MIILMVAAATNRSSSQPLTYGTSYLCAYRVRIGGAARTWARSWGLHVPG